MPANTHPASHPYAVVWRGAVGTLIGHSGTLSTHVREDLAVKAARRSRDAIRDLWPGIAAPWFIWSVVDRRDGVVKQLIR